ncbi:MAG: peptide-methionine (R)-S-oxide reductase MsrB [Sphingomonadales bacterium]|jgi:peptide-methionine (R)-S-oxide reductase|nr:peptide-methionine (R)-S-oxide reductase MsrB [Sphingomonadales bacterium]
MSDWSRIVAQAQSGNPAPPRRVEKTPEEWRAQLSPLAFAVAREHGTERPFSDPMCAIFQPGLYGCACCGTRLFDATSKFDSGTGWPSFTAPVEDNVIAYVLDTSHGMQRVETLCNVCDAHLGHVFPDGPPPTGLRFCMNAAALEKVES